MKLMIALGILLAQAPAAQTPVQTSTQAACAFTAPAGWNKAATRWDGTCREGHAEGLGVLKEYQQQKVVKFFFGRLEHGEPKLGVIDQEEGFVAGQFAKGERLESDDRQQMVDAFAEAEKAANEAASRFSKAGKQASAKFYADKAKALREQLD
jgi:uncharacterized membrane protein